MNRAKNMQISANLVRSFLQSCSVYAGALPLTDQAERQTWFLFEASRIAE
jgi:hypothetical protein